MSPNLVSRHVSIQNRRGLHARASAKFVQAAARFRSRIWVEKDGIQVSASSIMGLMLLAAATGEALTISAEGPDAADALDTLVDLVECGFDEE